VGTGFLSRKVKRPEGDADHLPPSGAEVNNEWSCTYPPPRVPSWRGQEP